MKGKALATTLLVAISLSVAARAQTAAKEALVEEHLARAAALEKNRSYAQAETECRAALEVDPENARVRFALGDVLSRQQKWDAAIDEYREAVKINPDFADAHNNLGIALESAGDRDGARE